MSSPSEASDKASVCQAWRRCGGVSAATPLTAIQFSARRVWICACCAGLATATLDVGVLRPSCRCAASFLKPMALAALGSRPSDSRYRCRGDRTMLFKLDAGSWLTRENIDLIVVPYNF